MSCGLQRYEIIANPTVCREETVLVYPAASVADTGSVLATYLKAQFCSGMIRLLMQFEIYDSVQ